MSSTEKANGSKDESSPTDLPAQNQNPYGFPQGVLKYGTFEGLSIMRFPVSDDPVTHIQKIRNLPMKEDDVMIAAYMKCGTHWAAEILHMLKTGEATHSNRVKEHNMLELCNNLTSLESELSPRIFNSHLRVAHLPTELLDKKIKIVHLIRNPKDTAVSWYHHLQAMHPAECFNFDNFIKGYMIDDYTGWSHQFDYLRQMSDFEKNHPDHPIKHVHYEDLKKSPVPIIQELSEFLGRPASQAFCEEVAQACCFAKMKEVDNARVMPVNLRGKINPAVFYRKGIVGDWKNQFTVAQNEVFDKFILAQEKKGLAFTFRQQ